MFFEPLPLKASPLNGMGLALKMGPMGWDFEN